MGRLTWTFSPSGGAYFQGPRAPHSVARLSVNARGLSLEERWRCWDGDRERPGRRSVRGRERPTGRLQRCQRSKGTEESHEKQKVRRAGMGKVRSRGKEGRRSWEKPHRWWEVGRRRKEYEGGVEGSTRGGRQEVQSQRQAQGLAGESRESTQSGKKGHATWGRQGLKWKGGTHDGSSSTQG